MKDNYKKQEVVMATEKIKLSSIYFRITEKEIIVIVTFKTKDSHLTKTRQKSFSLEISCVDILTKEVPNCISWE